MTTKAKKAKKPAAKKASTAIAVRPKKAPTVTIEDPQGLMKGSLVPVGQLGELATVGALGLAELKLTEKEESVLARPVNPQDILVRDAGIAYLPHIVYTRWFGEAFGRTGWSIVPTSRPQRVGNVVLIPYLLYVHGIPVAAATGEHEYHETNSRQTYGDVIESTVACALRRCAKRLGVGLEMWDKAWLQANVGKQPKEKPAQRQTVRSEEFVDASAREVSSQLENPAGVITAEQRKRLATIVERVARPAAEVSAWLKARYGVASSKDIKQTDYKAICQQLEARGALVFPGDGE